MYNKYNQLTNKLKSHYTRNIHIFITHQYIFSRLHFFWHTNYLQFIANVNKYLFWLKSLKEFHFDLLV
jgi:hypothetical protein